MPTYKAPVADMAFLLNDVLTLEDHAAVPGFEEASPDLVQAILTEGARLAEEVLHPINLPGDAEGCKLENGVVTTPKGFPEAYRLYAEAGWTSLTADPRYGGQGLPGVLNMPLSEMFAAANMALSLYPNLASGAILTIQAHASDDLKQTFLPPLVDGRWTGTMNLTEPQAGSDVGLSRTKAEPAGDGTYRITGSKMFISGGDHDLAENIVHLLLARLPGAPEGTKGISLFIVPKFLVNADGTLGERNAISVGAIEEKMGIHGNATCLLNYDGATGYLVGEENKGLNAMFTMMNEARISVGLQGVGVGEAAYQNAANYARERLQGRAANSTKPKTQADPIIVHPDVRRMLMTCRALTEGNRALAYWTALQDDLAHKATDETQRRTAADLLGLMTPVVKAFGSDKGCEVANLALQVFGGHGYVREWGMEHYARDARIPPIYEGTNGIQAMDLVGRKLPMDGGRGIALFFSRVAADIAAADGTDLAPLAAPLAEALEHQRQATAWLAEAAGRNPDHLGAAAVDYLHLMGLVAVGWMWLRMARAATARLAANEGDPAFLRAKLITARYYMERLLPEAAARRAALEAGADSLMAMDAEAF